MDTRRSKGSRWLNDGIFSRGTWLPSWPDQLTDAPTPTHFDAGNVAHPNRVARHQTGTSRAVATASPGWLFHFHLEGCHWVFGLPPALHLRLPACPVASRCGWRANPELKGPNAMVLSSRAAAPCHPSPSAGIPPPAATAAWHMKRAIHPIRRPPPSDALAMTPMLAQARLPVQRHG